MSATDPKDIRLACVFCGATDRKITKEHLWPNWLRNYIEVDRRPIRHTRLAHRPGEDNPQIEQWESIPLDHKVRVVCEPCNRGWMEALERLTQPILIPMLRNEVCLLNPDAQRTLAQWATLRLMMAQYIHPQNRRAIPAISYHRFHQDRELPIGAQIWLARYNGGMEWPTSYRHVALHFSHWGGPSPDLPNGYLAAFSVGYVAFVYLGHEIEDGLIYTHAPDVEPFLSSLWPVGNSVTWPPGGLLGEGGLDAIIRSFPV